MKAKADTGLGQAGTTDGAAGPSPAQKRYLERGLKEPGGKLPLFDEDGREIPTRTIEVCVARGWTEPWAKNPVRPGWLVCRLTPAGYRALGKDSPKNRA